MAKNSVRDFSSTAASNTDIQSVNIDENCAASGINNAIREVMADIKDVSTGAVALETPQADGLTIGTSNLDMNGNEVILDADADTSITADTDDQIDFKVGGADQIALTDGVLAPSTDDDVDLGSTTKRFNDLFLGGGLYVGGTGSSNYLDDFEEGTFTHSLTNTGATINGGFLSGAYVKIGDLIFVCGAIVYGSGTATGTIALSGLPFANGVNSHNFSVMSFEGSVAGTAVTRTARINTNVTTVDTSVSSGTGGSNLVYMGMYRVS